VKPPFVMTSDGVGQHTTLSRASGRSLDSIGWHAGGGAAPRIWLTARSWLADCGSPSTARFVPLFNVNLNPIGNDMLTKS
jgi:hypothetical protein